MHTPFFPQFRPRLAPCRRRLTQTVRHASLAQLEHYLEGIFPPHLLAQEDEGLNSRDRIFSLRLTFQCFLWQLLKPKTACREVVRQVQALFRLKGRGPVDEDTGAYCQARQRLPKTRLEQIVAATAATADQSRRRLLRSDARYPTEPATVSPARRAEARLRLSRDQVPAALLVKQWLSAQRRHG